ncbi:hypothetical protein FAF44_52750, partial [Nonomuraea sp. MG754425]|uniref:hypothetical protein n=1 Tax=Nonomuraea sp. MG754425 TaxID=2570319 RepID=UPI001F30DCCE
MSKKAFDTAITQARDLLRWRSPLRTELWAARLTAELEAPGRPDESGPDHETAPVGGTVSDEGSGPRADGGPAGGAGQARSAERVPAFLRRLAENGGPEARLTLAALSAVNGPVEAARNAEPAERTDTGETTGQSGPGAVSGPDHPGGVGQPYSSAGEG